MASSNQTLKDRSDMFYERNYSSAMSVYAASLAGGSQVGPLIAGYLIQAKGWRWFFILCAIIAAFNLVTTIFLLPETLYEPDEEPQSSTNFEKDGNSHIEAVRASSHAGQRAQMDYKVYWSGLFTMGISKEARQRGVFKYTLYQFVLPFPLLLIPGVLIASIMYGVALGG